MLAGNTNVFAILPYIGVLWQILTVFLCLSKIVDMMEISHRIPLFEQNCRHDRICCIACRSLRLSYMYGERLMGLPSMDQMVGKWTVCAYDLFGGCNRCMYDEEYANHTHT
jgi:hypothetical protein